MAKVKLKIYLDTSVISAYFDSRQGERMRLTQESWQKIKQCQIFISEITFKELQDTTDPVKRKQFLRFIKGFNILLATPETKQLTKLYANFMLKQR